jgi:TolB-like protein
MGEAACRWVYEFGEFRLDACRRVLSVAADGARITVAPKVFDAAFYLVQRAGELIPKDRMLADLWPGVVVEENSLTQLISELRHAFGEARGDNRYIVTVPRRGYQFVAEVKRVSIAPASPPVPDRSIAVLPFGNPGHATEDDLLATGIPESIRHRLAGLSGLRLVAHESSSLQLRGQNGDARAIGRRLGARYLVQGTVQHLGSHLRVTAQLVDAIDGSHLWSLRVDRTAVDGFALEDDVAQQVACAVCRSLLGTASVDATEPPVVTQGGLSA